MSVDSVPNVQSLQDAITDYTQGVAAAVRSRRQLLGLTQAEMARRTGIARPNICRIESGKHTPAIETLARLCAAFGCTVGELFASASAGAANDVAHDQSFTKSG